MDGLIDMYLYPPDDYGTRNYGYAKAAGDVNGDGLCDLAVSAPMFYSAPLYATGRVFIYSGNTALTDTVVANDDPVELEAGWELNVYPNPLRTTDMLNIDLSGPGHRRPSPQSLELFNLRGERVYSVRKIGEVQNDTPITMSIPSLANGLYILKIVNDDKITITKRICILK